MRYRFRRTICHRLYRRRSPTHADYCISHLKSIERDAFKYMKGDYCVTALTEDPN